MGKKKYKGEEAEKKHCQKYYIIRTSWLYGLNGKNFVETMISLQNSPSLKVVDDQYGCPTWTKDLADALIKTLEKENYGIYHICGSNYISWYGFAKKIFELLDIKTSLQPVKTKDYNSRAQRPKYSVMDNNQSCRSWELALIDYIKLRNKDK